VAKTPTAQLKAGGKYGDLKRRLVFLLLALVVYRVGAHIPVPGIDPEQLSQLFKSQSGGVLGLFNLFSGGALVGDVSAPAGVAIHRGDVPSSAASAIIDEHDGAVSLARAFARETVVISIAAGVDAGALHLAFRNAGPPRSS
jgi:hypothetical protein